MMKKIGFILLICMTSLFFAGCNESDLEDAADMVQDVVQQTDPYVQSVKNATPDEYPGITYGEAFEEFFGNPAWKHFTAYADEEDSEEEAYEEVSSYEEEDTTEKTVEVVEFTGKCMYQDQEVKAVMQYTISDDEETFELTYFAFNKIAQNLFVYSALFDNAFESYQEKHMDEIESEMEDSSFSEEEISEEEMEAQEEVETESDMESETEETEDSDEMQEEDNYLSNTLPEEDVDYIEYIIPHSSEIKVTKSDLKGLTAKELTYARNEIYARHGYVFNSKELNKYFRSTDWYVPDKSYDGTLSAIEQKNAAFISKYQNEKGLTYKPK